MSGPDVEQVGGGYPSIADLEAEIQSRSLAADERAELEDWRRSGARMAAELKQLRGEMAAAEKRGAAKERGLIMREIECRIDPSPQTEKAGWRADALAEAYLIAKNRT